LNEPGIGFLAEPLRLYPNRELAAHVLGFEGVDGGLEGVERAWNEALAGTPGRAIVGRDALGREIAAQQILTPPAPGRGVMLTLDQTIQYLAEREIDAAYRRTHARAALAIAMDPRSGAVLALGGDRYHHYMTAFGFGAPTGIGLPGESRGLLRDPQRWSALSLPTMSIGQEVSVTALQMLAAFGAVANGGTLMQPRLVKAE